VAARPAIVAQNFNFVIGSKIFSLLGPISVDRTGENRLMSGQDYSRDVAAPPNAFPPLFLLSQQRCADARCRGGDRRF
jgi:hypothetical protein